MADKEEAGPADESRDPSDGAATPGDAHDEPVDETTEPEQGDDRYELDDPEALEELYRAESGGPDAEQLDEDELVEPDEPTADPVETASDEPGGRAGSTAVVIDPSAPKRRQPTESGTTGTLVKSGTKGGKGPTPNRDRPRAAKPARTTPAKFTRESVGELRKVVYPTGQQVIQYFVVVLVFVLFIIGYVGLLDLGLGTALFKLFS